MNQRLIIGDSIEITVVELRDGHVRLGVTAPKTVSVYRSELLEQIAAENTAAVASAQTAEVLADIIDTNATKDQPSVAALTQSGPAAQNEKGG